MPRTPPSKSTPKSTPKAAPAPPRGGPRKVDPPAPPPVPANRRAVRARGGRGSDAPTPPADHAPDERRTAHADDPDKRFRFDVDRRARLLLHIRAGASVDDACARIGCSPNTPREWDDAGCVAREKELRGETLDDRERAQLAFSDDYRAARAEVDTRLIAQIVTQSQKDWRAAAHLLALKDPSRYSEKYAVRMAQIDAERPIRDAEQRGKELANQLLEEKLAAIKEIREKGGRLMVVGAEDVFEAIMHSERLTPEARQAMLDFFKAEGFRFVVERDLGAEPAGSTPMMPAE